MIFPLAATCLALIEKPCGRTIQRLGDFRQNRHGRIANAALDSADVSPVQAAIFGQLLLRNLPFLPEMPQIEANPLAYVH